MKIKQSIKDEKIWKENWDWEKKNAYPATLPSLHLGGSGPLRKYRSIPFALWRLSKHFELSSAYKQFLGYDDTAHAQTAKKVIMIAIILNYL